MLVAIQLLKWISLFVIQAVAEKLTRKRWRSKKPLLRSGRSRLVQPSNSGSSEIDRGSYRERADGSFNSGSQCSAGSPPPSDGRA